MLRQRGDARATMGIATRAPDVARPNADGQPIINVHISPPTSTRTVERIVEDETCLHLQSNVRFTPESSHVPCN